MHINKIFNANKLDSKSDLRFFVKYGFVIYRNVFKKKIFNQVRDNIINSYNTLLENYKKKKITLSSWRWSKAISLSHENNIVTEEFYKSQNLISILVKYIGPDICILNNTCIYLQDPKLKKYNTSLNIHSDMWTGNSVDTIHLNTFMTDANKNNSLTLYPGSHMLGLLPVKSRKLDEQNFKLKNQAFTLDNIKKGDVLIFHPLLLHASVNKAQNKKTRISIGDRVKSFEKVFSSQEKSLGYRVINIGPINHIKRVIGNDYLQPLRVYDGAANISLALQDSYDLLKENNSEDISIKKFYDLIKKNEK